METKKFFLIRKAYGATAVAREGARPWQNRLTSTA